MKQKVKGIIYGAAAAASYGTNPLFALPLYAGGIGVNSVLFYRYFFAVIIYWFWIKFYKKKSLKISLKEFFSLSSLTLFESFKYIEAGIACTVLFVYPVIVAILMSVFFKEKLSKILLVSILLTSVGIGLLYKGKTNIDLNIYGIGMVFLSAVLYALYIIGVKNIKTVKHINSTKLSFYVILFGLIVYIYNLKFCTQLQIITNPLLIFYALCLSLFPTIISIETITLAIKLIGSTPAAILGALEPLTAIFFGVVIFHEQLTLRIIIGIILILSGVFLVISKNK